MKLIALSLLAGFFTFAEVSHAAAPMVPASQMTCEQAVAVYQKHKRIYVLANGRDLVPIYGMLPKAEWRKLVCRGRNKSRGSYWVKTLDDDTCVIAVHCR